MNTPGACHLSILGTQFWDKSPAAKVGGGPGPSCSKVGGPWPSCPPIPTPLYSIRTLDGYDIVGNSVKNKSDPAIHLFNITVFGGSTNNKLMICGKNHFFLHSNSEFNQNRKKFGNSFYCRDIV